MQKGKKNHTFSATCMNTSSDDDKKEGTLAVAF
jgi:hypothetical protein